MLCIRPFRSPRAEFGCGQCLPCRINRKRTWAARIILESLAYSESSFVTLTYDADNVPPFHSLSKDHWREFTKGIGYRYFGCGEYGSLSSRPHYHFVLFGLPAVRAEDFAASRWPYGFVCARPFAREHAAYTASYVTKKWIASSPMDKRIPEFAHMSRRPGIGVPGLAPWLRWLSTCEGSRVIAQDLDVPKTVRINGSIYPLGRLLVDRLRSELDVVRDNPARTFRRELKHRVLRCNPEWVKFHERKRVARYEVLRDRALRKHGTL